MDQITVKAFLISVSRTTYNPMRHIAADLLPASENPVVYRRRINLNQEPCRVTLTPVDKLNYGQKIYDNLFFFFIKNESVKLPNRETS